MARKIDCSRIHIKIVTVLFIILTSVELILQTAALLKNVDDETYHVNTNDISSGQSEMELNRLYERGDLCENPIFCASSGSSHGQRSAWSSRPHGDGYVQVSNVPLSASSSWGAYHGGPASYADNYRRPILRNRDMMMGSLGWGMMAESGGEPDILQLFGMLNQAISGLTMMALLSVSKPLLLVSVKLLLLLPVLIPIGLALLLGGVMMIVMNLSNLFTLIG